MAWYDTGTVSVTNGSTTVTGSGTNFIAGAQIGEAFYGPDERLYEIQAIVSATSLTLGSPYLGANQTGQDYYIIPTQSLVATLASQVSTLISDFQSVADEAGEGKFDDGTAALPGITFTLDQDTGFSRPAANQIGFSTAGVQRALLSSTALTLNVPLTAAAISGTTLTATGDVTIPDRIIHAGDTSTQIRFPAADTVTVETNGAERLRVTSTGNVGIGTSSPAAKLHLSFSNSGAAAVGAVSLAGFFEGATSAAVQVASGTGSPAFLFMGDAADTDATRIAAQDGFTQISASGASDFMRFDTGGFNERMRINSTGDILVGQSATPAPGVSNTTTGISFRPNGTIFASADAAGAFNANRNADGAVAAFRRSGDIVGSISVTTTTTSYNTSSDYRLKEDVQPMVGASDRVLSLKPCNFAWKADGSRVDGFLAHEAQAVVPEAVTGEKDGEEMQAIDQSKLVPLLTAALQDALKRIEALEAQLT